MNFDKEAKSDKKKIGNGGGGGGGGAAGTETVLYASLRQMR